MRRWLGALAVAVAGGACTQPPAETTPAPAKVISSPPPQAQASAARKPWPAGSVRAPKVSIGFGLRLVRGQPPAAAEAAVRRLAKRYFPGVVLFDLDAETYPPPPALGIGQLSAKPLSEGALRSDGVGLDAAAVALSAKPWPTTGVMLLARGDRAGAALRAFAGLVGDAARSLGAVIDDPEARLYYSPQAFAERVSRDGFEGDLPVVTRHMMIHTYEKEDGTQRSVTLGMSKLGLPDLVVEGHGRNSAPTVHSFINAVAQTLVERGRLERPGRLELDLRSLRSSTVREAMLASLKKGATAQASISIGEGKPEEGDAENGLMELTLEGKPGGPAERQEAVLTEVFGAEGDDYKHVEHDAEVLAESARAKAKLRALKPTWLRSRMPGEELMVKAPFRTPAGGNEWMWVEVTRWEGKRIQGLLANDAYEIPGLRSGAVVEVDEASVFDYLHRMPDGTSEGNTTQELLHGSTP